jgi:hypothetical protein
VIAALLVAILVVLAAMGTTEVRTVEVNDDEDAANGRVPGRPTASCRGPPTRPSCELSPDDEVWLSLPGFSSAAPVRARPYVCHRSACR